MRVRGLGALPRDTTLTMRTAFTPVVKVAADSSFVVKSSPVLTLTSGTPAVQPAATPSEQVLTKTIATKSIANSPSATLIAAYRMGRDNPTVLPMLTAVDTSKPAVTESPPTVEVEHIPPSDPRHPQHAEWLAEQEEEKSFLSRYGLWVGLGAAALLIGGVVLLRPRAASPTP